MLLLMLRLERRAPDLERDCPEKFAELLLRQVSGGRSGSGPVEGGVDASASSRKIRRSRSRALRGGLGVGRWPPAAFRLRARAAVRFVLAGRALFVRAIRRPEGALRFARRSRADFGIGMRTPTVCPCSSYTEDAALKSVKSHISQLGAERRNVHLADRAARFVDRPAFD